MVLNGHPGNEVARFAAKGEESPHVNFDTGAEIKHPASELARD